MAIDYTLVGWDTSKFVNPTNMNQMDDGIKAACDGVDEAKLQLEHLLAMASQRDILSDAWLVDLYNPLGELNKPARVQRDITVNLPADCAWGVREVFYMAGNSSTSQAYLTVTIKGMDTSGWQRIWMASYNEKSWVGWIDCSTSVDIDALRNNSVKVRTVVGNILNSSGGTVFGYGTATITLYGNGIARIEYDCNITSSGSKENVFSWGINRDFLTAGTDVVITPIQGGNYIVFDADGKRIIGLMGYGTTHFANGQFWNIGRNNDGNTVGAWPENQATQGMYLTGVCYGTYEV